jgi:small-conductance mechanosensitive channel
VIVVTHTQLELLIAVGVLALAILVGTILHRTVAWFLTRWSARSGNPFLRALVRETQRPAAFIVPLLCVLIAMPTISNDVPSFKYVIGHAAGLLVLAAIAWAMIAVIRVWGEVIIARHRFDVEDNLLARQLGTRVDILIRVTSIVIVIFAIGLMLMTFPEIRSIGTTLLASAGIAGLAIGFAARPLFENLVAGIQLAFTQPIRLDDVVVVQNYWGRIEEIHSTYVVIQVWDLRRLVVPLSWFLDNAFENWTRRTANLIGEVYFFADWTLDVEALRAQIPVILERSPLWDEKVQNCQVTDATDHAIQLRVLVSARNSGDLWDLRCFAREGIVAYLRDQQPQALPRLRVPPLDERGEQAKPQVDGAAHQPATNGQRVRTIDDDRTTGPG